MQEHKRIEKINRKFSYLTNLHFVNKLKNMNPTLKKKEDVTSSDTKPNFIKGIFNTSPRKRGLPENTYRVNLLATKRNVRLSLSNPEGLHLFSLTSGLLGNKKSKRSNPFFSKIIFLKFVEVLAKHGMPFFVLYIKGFGRFRRPLVRLFGKSKLKHKCVAVLDITPKSHNGCRLRASRRL